ncbi:terminase small subunit [Clostridioides difficile]
MARVRSPARDEAKKLYLESNGEMKLVDIAAKLNILDSQVRKWKSQDKWEQELKGALPKSKSNVTNKKTNKKSSKKGPIADEVKEVLENTELTEKQRLFCIYYIEDFNATKAYKKAYDCSYATAMVEGSKSLRKPKIKKEIDRLTKECLNEQEVSSKLLNKRLFEMYMKIAFADIGDYLRFGQEEEKVWNMNEDGSFKPSIDPETGEQKVRRYNVVNLNESDEVDTTIISEVSEGKDGVKVKLLDKMKALEWLDKHYGEGTEEQKLKISKLRGEVNKLENGDKDKPIEILIKRKERG